MRRSSIASVVVLGLGLAAAARADAPPPPGPSGAPGPSLHLVATPIFGADAATGTGWSEIVARLDNTGTSAQRGILELSLAQGWSSGELEPAARAPFFVPAGRSAIVSIPAHGFNYYAPQALVTAKTDAGAKIESVSVTLTGATSPLLVDVDQPSRLAIVLRGWPVHAKWLTTPPTTGTGALSVGVPGFDRATGDPILPERASGYSAVTVVVLHSDRLVALDEARRDALVGWVQGGGTLALVVARPEDLRAPVVASLVGGDARAATAPKRLFVLPAFEKPASADTLGNPGTAPGGGGDEEEAPTTPGAPLARGPKVLRLGPAPELRDRVTGYEGGRLQASDFGASAPCGLGELHLLAFDPTAPPMLDDPWAQTRMIDLVARAWDRHARIALPIGGGDRSPGRMDEIRRALDPNENFRLGLGISAVLLVLYSIVVGPLVFARASKRGRPLLPLAWVPVWSGVAFAMIVVVGLGVKGWRGRARHLTFLEAGSGSARASMRAYRGFFASETRSLTVAPSGRGSVLGVAPTDGASHVDYGVLRLDRDGVTLGDLTSLPWQTVVVREDGFADLKGGVSFVRNADGSHDVINRTGRTLKDVLVHEPKSDVVYLTTIDDGEQTPASRGRVLHGIGAGSTLSGGKRVHALDSRDVALVMTGREGRRIADEWGPLEATAGDAIDWWPEDAPVLIAELVGPSVALHPAQDSGLAVESDRVLVRVVGSEVAP